MQAEVVDKTNCEAVLRSVESLHVSLVPSSGGNLIGGVAILWHGGGGGRGGVPMLMLAWL